MVKLKSNKFDLPERLVTLGVLIWPIKKEGVWSGWLGWIICVLGKLCRQKFKIRKIRVNLLI